MKGVKLDIPFVEKASRMELLIRIGYFIVYYIVSMIFSFLFVFTWGIQTLMILLLGKRNDGLQKINVAYIKYLTEFFVYFYTLTDERPDLMPKF